jgi:hypothetical protein
MTSRCLFAIAIAAGSLVACRNSNDSTAPGDMTAAPLYVAAFSTTNMIGIAGGDAPVLPVVHVTRISDNHPQGGVTVVFALAGPDGLTSLSSVATDEAGVAKLPSWRIGQTIGAYTATAMAGGNEPIVFSVHLRGSIVGIYDRTAYGDTLIDVKPDGEHIVLFEDKTYSQFFGLVDTYTYPSGVDGTYAVNGSSVDFLDDPSRANPNEKAFGFLRAHGALIGSTLKVTYIGYDQSLSAEYPAPPPESYVLRGN